MHCVTKSDIFLYRLGDRHGENILFEEGTGGILHVDFNCLFDKVCIHHSKIFKIPLTGEGIDVR